MCIRDRYYATETVAIEGEGTVPVTCTVDGTAGNLPAHSVTQMPVAVQGIACLLHTSSCV